MRISNGPKDARHAFTLVELLAVIAMIGILAAILIPVIGSVLDQADTAKSTSNLRNLGSATSLYVADNNYEVPMRGVRPNFSNPPWYISLSDYIGITLKGQGSVGFHEESADNILRNPATEDTDKPVNYAPSMSCSAEGNTKGMIVKVTDIVSPSSKVWLSTSTQSYSYNPYLSPPLGIEYPHDGHANVLYFDGSVALIPESEVIAMGRQLLDPTAE